MTQLRKLQNAKLKLKLTKLLKKLVLQKPKLPLLLQLKKKLSNSGNRIKNTPTVGVFFNILRRA